MHPRAITFSGLLLIVAGLAVVAAARNSSKPMSGVRSNMPAGYAVMVLKPSKATLSLMGLIECPELEGAQHVAEGSHKRLVSADGATIRQFPQRFSFRITASLKKIFIEGPDSSVDVAGDPQELLLKLKFRVRAYNGLESREIEPQSIEMIGVPADVPYDERVYRINVDTGNLPITDRVIIEILSPQGELLTHFPFSLL
ncbi:MAG TPA: hypothetical protein VKV30_14535 [Candidatus Angelobacter sp.]|nr:hypothetical protein [Candidatus Angelobacter sp.]